MISVMNNDCEFDRKSDTIEENKVKSSVPDDDIDSSDGKRCINYDVSDEFRVSSMELDLGAPESDGDVRVSENERSMDVRVCMGSDGSVDKKMESRVFEVKDEKESVDRFDPQNGLFEAQNDRFDPHGDRYDANNGGTEHMVSKIDRHVEMEKHTVSQYKSLLSEFDDYVANEKMGVGMSRALSYGFEVGDMVWGKVKSHPWWPGHIFNEALASPSVRRTRRDGHVLVAFFGDSSYGWFDPAELIPFDPHFAEKSQQTTSRTFVRAVEEAMDELSRRRGLGLVCKCRNPYNFRPTNIQGYFAVDVPDYEPGGVYSAYQIRKASNSFQPGETLSFVSELALRPRDSEPERFEFIKNKATVFALRKAVFEEFDETYAQAFGVQPARPFHNPDDVLDQPFREPARAPLSGPLVIAEALGGGKSSKKPMKVKDHAKKDRYLFKRRDEPSDLRTLQISQGQASSSAPSTYTEGSSAFAGGDYVLQKRAPVPQIAARDEATGFISQDGAGSSSGEISGKEALTIHQGPAHSGTLASHGAAVVAKSSLDMLEMKERMQLDVGVGPTGTGVIDGTSPPFQREGEVMVDLKFEESTKLSRSYEGFQQSGVSSSARGGHGMDQVQDGHAGLHPSPIDAKRSGGMSADVGLKKAKVLKRPLGDLGSENSIAGDKKKKKKKKEFGSEASADHPRKRLAPGKGGAVVGHSAGKATRMGLAPRDDLGLNLQKKDVGTSYSSVSSLGTSPMVGMGNSELELPQILGDLHALALDPFHGLERNIPTIIRRFFLRFRSLIYQKSLVVLPASETEPVEVWAAKSPSSVGTSDYPPAENARDLTPSKPVKTLVRPDDPTKAGRKRLPSDRQEEIAAKRLKKITHMKSLTAEKKVSQKTLEPQRAEAKEQVAAAPLKPIKLDSVKKMEPPARAVDPTMLVMKFPPRTSLPSVAELKARFARFGSLDQSAIRVFWKSSTCRVVFRHKVDAQAAYKYANGNSSLFGNVSVRYFIREMEGPAPEIPEPNKGRGDDTTIETPRIKEAKIERLAPALAHQPLVQQTVQLKSILKKATGDEAGQVTGGNGGSRGTPRVKFMLGGEETSREEQLMIGNRNNFNNNPSFADGGAPSSVAMDFNSKNFQKVITLSPSSPILPLPQFAKPPLNNMHHIEVLPWNSHNLNSPSPTAPPPPPPPPSATTIDISQQMLSLLTRCNDVVTNVTGFLGYVPYHPL